MMPTPAILEQTTLAPHKPVINSVVCVGDYVYEFGFDGLTTLNGNVEVHDNEERCQSLIDEFAEHLGSLGWTWDAFSQGNNGC